MSSCQQSSWMLICLRNFCTSKPSFGDSLSPPPRLSLGDTLLAIRAPIGTQLEVPVPEAVSWILWDLGLLSLSSSWHRVSCCSFPHLVQVLNGQRKYQIRLKSSTGPIEVLLVNKDPSSASPVVLPVPPPDDVLQSLPTPTATPTSQQSTVASQVHSHCRYPHPPWWCCQSCRVTTAINAVLKNLILAPPQVTKASSTKPGPAAITSATAANQTASVTGAKHSLVNSCMGFEIT